MSVIHVVAFRVADPAMLPALSAAMLALKDECRRDGAAYIVRASGGRQSSSEGHCGDMQVVFVVEFKDQADADYYITEDPAHTAFKNKLGAWGLQGVTVLDFTPGVF